MHVNVNGTRLYFDVEGSALVADGPKMRERPTVILLHGGPGADHAVYKPAFSRLTEVAQVIYLDHRGNGRSDQSTPDHWTLAQWGDDVRAFCETLGIERPIVLGTSFGGFVAQSYLTRHPEHPGAVILISTAGKFDFELVYDAFARRGGPAAGAAARAYWDNPTSASRLAYRDVCVPLYTVSQEPADWISRVIIKDDVALWFNGPMNEQGRMDFLSSLSCAECPVLVMAGEEDPITPPVFSEQIVENLPPHLTRFERFAGCGHGIVTDNPERVFSTLFDFIEQVHAAEGADGP